MLPLFLTRKFLYQILSILVDTKLTPDISCPSRVPPWNHASAFVPQFLFVLLHNHTHRFPFVLHIVDHQRIKYQMCAPINHDCNTVTFPWSSSLYTVNVMGSVISLAGGFWVDTSFWKGVICLYILWRQKLAFFLKRIPSL